jgi:hypothetical protein
MNNPTRWAESRLEDGSVRFISESTFGGAIVVTAQAVEGKVVWDKPNDVPVLLAERAARTLGV